MHNTRVRDESFWNNQGWAAFPHICCWCVVDLCGGRARPDTAWTARFDDESANPEKVAREPPRGADARIETLSRDPDSTALGGVILL